MIFHTQQQDCLNCLQQSENEMLSLPKWTPNRVVGLLQWLVVSLVPMSVGALAEGREYPKSCKWSWAKYTAHKTDLQLRFFQANQSMLSFHQPQSDRVVALT